MTRRGTRWLAPIALAFTLLLGLGSSALAQQEEPAPEGSGAGRPFDGYFATGCLAGLVLFVVAKSARR